ncbi:alpha/beta-hydrolase [Periconia macrospinosa]|uniref:Alpha/beta-hydrolase n=1 Tax=Periconia macrospinosa TaxID=97972 RepID=A0A2V1EB41_9PLEO|nr:alpha/beta-hydrolase [Periconia macrospinosa]
MQSSLHSISYFFHLPFHIQWRTALVQIPRYVPLSILHITSPKGPQPFVIALPSRKNDVIPIYVFVPPAPVQLEDQDGQKVVENGEWKVPVVLDFHGGGFIMGSPLEQAPYAAMVSRELGAVVISVSYRIGPFSQFPAAIHDGEDVLSAILDQGGQSKAGRVLRTEIQRYLTMRKAEVKKKKKAKNEQSTVSHLEGIDRITLDPTRLAISGFSSGGNIALNMIMSAPPCAQLIATSPTCDSSRLRGMSTPDTFSPLLPPRAHTQLDDPHQDWPTVLPSPEEQPRMIPLLLFYPSLDARALPHERPMKPLPNALKGDDKKPHKQRRPGLFSIMGPTYLPKKLRAHPRASPGLVHPDNLQKNAAIFLVLPEKDTLAVQSDVWVDKMNTSGWNGPARFGDGRENDWNGHSGGGDASMDRSRENGGLEIWHAPMCRHGWTQFPEPVLGKHEKKERLLVFARMLDFVKDNWNRKLEIDNPGSPSQETRPLEKPARFSGLN